MLKTLGALSSLNFHQADGTVTVRPDYLVVRTPTRPRFFWGNFIIFPEAPVLGDLESWKKIYQQEFDLERQGFMAMSWDSNVLGEVKAFLDAGFTLEDQYVMRLSKLLSPSGVQTPFEVRVIEKPAEWDQLLLTQRIQDWPLSSPQELFLKDKVAAYQRLQSRGYGVRLGAFLNERLVGDLGIYVKDGLGRFNNVCTHSEHYNQGVAKTLVSEASRWALAHLQVSQLVILADKNHYAFKIYQQLGYDIVGAHYELTWMSEQWKS